MLSKSFTKLYLLYWRVMMIDFKKLTTAAVFASTMIAGAPFAYAMDNEEEELHRAIALSLKSQKEEEQKRAETAKVEPDQLEDAMKAFQKMQVEGKAEEEKQRTAAVAAQEKEEEARKIQR